MPRLFLLLFLADLALTIVALIDCLSTDAHEIRGLPKIVWVFLIVLFFLVGPIAWFLAGRPQRVTVDTSPSWHPAGTANGSAGRQVAPDDNPEFLRELASRSRRDDEDLLRQWEADLRRREEELRRRETTGEDEPPTA